jgi:hypothetical protein
MGASGGIGAAKRFTFLNNKSNNKFRFFKSAIRL